MRYVVDIDGTICHTDLGRDYQDAVPYLKRIEYLNQLYDNGNIIVYFTARGMRRTNNNVDKAKELFYDLTKSQLLSWEAKYHELILGKPSADVYLDDKSIDIEYFFGE
jgi:phosphatidate phosphatase PAH1